MDEREQGDAAPVDRVVRLSWPMRRTLEDMVKYDDAWRRVRGRSMHGGMTAVMPALLRRGLVAYRNDVGYVLTDAGRTAVEPPNVQDNPPARPEKKL